MDLINGGHGPPQSLSPEALALFTEGVALVLCRWTALQMAVQGQWGGRNSSQKADIMANGLISWFLNAKDPLYIDALEDILDENMLVSFQTEIDDGSIEEVAEQLMVIHEDCLQGNFESVFRLRNSNTGEQAVSQSRQVVDETAADETSEEESDMVVDGVNRPQESRDADEGWTVVAPRRNRGTRTR